MSSISLTGRQRQIQEHYLISLQNIVDTYEIQKFQFPFAAFSSIFFPSLMLLPASALMNSFGNANAFSETHAFCFDLFQPTLHFTVREAVQKYNILFQQPLISYRIKIQQINPFMNWSLPLLSVSLSATTYTPAIPNTLLFSNNLHVL